MLPLNITDVRDKIPECKGTRTFYMPVDEGYNKNLILVKYVSNGFIKAMKHLIQTGLIELEFVDPHIFIADGSKTYLPVAQEEDLKGNRECWFPVRIKRI